MQHTVYLFDRFRLDVTRRKLLSAGGLVQPLNSRAMEALLVLVANAGEVIEKKTLMQAVWPHTVVEDNNLNQCVLAIRKALGESAGANRFVMTVPGRGFCFVCPVQKRIQFSDDEVPGINDAEGGARPGRTGQHPPRDQGEGAINEGSALRRLQAAAGPPFWFGLALGGALTALLMLPLARH